MLQMRAPPIGPAFRISRTPHRTVPDPTPTPPKRLLVVDDEQAMRTLLTDVLGQAGIFEVRTAENGAAALEILNTEPVDAVLTDLDMPVMDGFQLLARIMRENRSVPVAILSGLTLTPEARGKLHRLGTTVFQKPADLDTLTDELQKRFAPGTTGYLRGITLFGFLQLLEMEAKTCAVVVQADGRTGRLYFESGRLVHAEVGECSGLAAISELAAWEDAGIDVLYDRTAPVRTIDAPLQRILMDATRLLDERSAAPEPAPPEPAKPAKSPKAPKKPRAPRNRRTKQPSVPGV